MAYLVDRLKATTDPAGGSLFDSAVVFWGNELGKGNDHSRDDAPYLIASGAAGPFRTGRHLRYTGTVPHNNLLVSILNGFAIEAKTFGKPEWCTGALANLT